MKVLLDPGAFAPERAHPDDAGTLNGTRTRTPLPMRGMYGRKAIRGILFSNG